MICEYCGSKQDKGVKCIKCGAPALEEKKERKSEPFFYNGYIVYVIKDFSRDLLEFQFWLGITLVETIQIPRDLLQEIVPYGYDEMPTIWKLFEAAQGKDEVLKYQTMNKDIPAMFEIRHIENPEHAARRQYIRELLDK